MPTPLSDPDQAAQDEAARLATLHSLHLLDTEPDERFDRLTRMAVKLFDVSVAMITFVDSTRVWIKSATGSDIKEVPRDDSFCSQAIMHDKGIIVEDTLQGEHFRNHQMVCQAPNIRFYAGCPIHAPNGHRIGTFCIFDLKPRPMSEADTQYLYDLAAITEQEIFALHIAITDELTDILNRRGFMLMAKQTLSLFRRNSIPASLAFIDLDRFKSINDSYGHAEGDRVLRLFSRLLKDTFRSSDIVARICGDEFVVLMARQTASEAQSIFDRFYRELDNEVEILSLPYEIKFSYGVIDFDRHRHVSVDSLLADGDMLMYRAKRLRQQAII